MKSIASRLFPERWRVVLCPDRVIVARLAGGLRPRVSGKDIVECTAPVSGPPWQASLAALEKILARSAPTKAPAVVVLSSHFVRYAIVPWRDNVVADAERQVLARHCFKSIYGDAVRNWNVQVSDDGFRRNAVASAVDGDLVVELNRLFTQHGRELLSVEPYFMTVSNRFRRTLRTRGAACVTMLENGRAIVGFFDRAGWQALTVRRLAQASPDALLTLLTQEAQSVNIAPLPERLFVAALEDPRMQLSAGEWPIRMLSLQPRVGFSPFDDARYAMALCGAA